MKLELNSAKKMKKRKTKSRLTKVDLDAVLKLQRNYTTLEERLCRLVEYAKERQNGYAPYFLIGDDLIDITAHVIDEMANRIKELENGKSREASPK